LPAICEQGYQSEAGSNATFCGTQTTPKIQNIQSSLVDNGNIGQISGSYWSSTENAGYPIDYSWYNQFSSSGSIQDDQYKDESLKVRCIRALTL
ncbi:MAG: hypothetical protein B7X00_01370, partial [Legionella sp. 21-45-4]